MNQQGAAGKLVTSRNIKIAFWLVTSLFFLWGFSYGLLDVMNKNFQNHLGITKAVSGLLQAAYFGGYFVIAIPASMVATKFGYKGGIIMGLALYALGALFIIPASNEQSFNLFLLAFFIIACGLGSLETNANPYITKLGSDEDAAFRINMAQSFNGVGQFLGPIVGGVLFLSLSHGNIDQNMANVQMVYVGIAVVVLAVLALFVFTRMPEGAEVSEAAGDVVEEDTDSSYGKLFSFRHFRLGVIAQFLYIAAQVGAGAFFINYSVEHWHGLADHEAAYFFSIALVAFLLGRIVTTPIMKKVKSNVILATYSLINAGIMVVLQFVHDLPAVIVLWLSFFFMSISFPTIFALSVVKIPNSLVKKAASLLIMSIVGGAFMPFFMGYVADHWGTGASFLLLLPCFLYVAWYGLNGVSKD
ncbi:MAG: L-fucose:H+ symporter permease [Veillonella sp.]|uniref:L-fucose:H+ symporter permease n=1 Tax=Veillonella sp. TaxID=1926307 RepID=UPI0025E5ABFE|nr:L-fucose:H+ symporter permease [Veillonella sp.]MBE6079821.1 L-fucose:H+ symporter permease [Veillonella sp.]